MEVTVRYQLVSKCSISSLSYNQHLSLLAITAHGNDTATFFAPTPNLILDPRFKGESRPPSNSIIVWSPNGRFVAVAGSKVEIWKIDKMRLSPAFTFSEGMVEIKNLCWSPDSKSYLCNGINPKEERISLKIREIESGESQNIFLSQLAVSANFDPFGKYIVALLKNNTLDIYDSHSLQKLYCISMAHSFKDIQPFKDNRMMDWSPDFAYLLLPNLNELKCPSAVLLDRHSKFRVHRILKGHASPINCVRFNPNIYEHEGKLSFLVAMGDTGGCVSIWRIVRGQSKENNNSKPLFIAFSPFQVEECIESLEWSRDGNELYANPLKKYLIIFKVNEAELGCKIRAEDKINLILSMYGAAGAVEIMGTKLEIFGLDRIASNEKKSEEPPMMEAAETDNKLNSQPLQEPQEFMKTQQETFINKATNKKRIIPSKVVPTSKIPVANNQFSTNYVSNFKLPILKGDVRKQYNLSDNLQLKYLIEGPARILTVCGGNRNRRRVFTIDISEIRVMKKQIMVVYAQRMLIFNYHLQLLTLPILIGEVSMVATNNQGIVYYLQTNGVIRGFNYQTKQFISETSIAHICPNEGSEAVTQLPISKMRVYDNDGGKVHIELENESRFFYSEQDKSWFELNLEKGIFKPGHSIKVSPHQRVCSERFFSQLAINPAPTLKTDAKFQQALIPFELELLYYQHYEKNVMKFEETLLKMISQVKAMGRDEELREIIVRFFFDPNSPDYQNKPSLWQRVKGLGGTVIEEFLMLKQ